MHLSSLYRVFIIGLLLTCSSAIAQASPLGNKSVNCQSVNCQSYVGVPQEDGERARYSVQIDIRKAYISGICVMLQEGGMLKSSIINEFGFSAMDFEYNPLKDKVRIVNVMKKLNRWYIKRMLKKDLREVIHILKHGGDRYENKKLNITYTFTPIEAPVTTNDNTDDETSE